MGLFEHWLGWKTDSIPFLFPRAFPPESNLWNCIWPGFPCPETKVIFVIQTLCNSTSIASPLMCLKLSLYPRSTASIQNKQIHAQIYPQQTAITTNIAEFS